MVQAAHGCAAVARWSYGRRSRAMRHAPALPRLLPEPAKAALPVAVATVSRISATPHRAQSQPLAAAPRTAPGWERGQEGEATPNAREALAARGHGASSTWMCCVRALEPWMAEPRDAPCPRAAAAPSRVGQATPLPLLLPLPVPVPVQVPVPVPVPFQLSLRPHPPAGPVDGSRCATGTHPRRVSAY